MLILLLLFGNSAGATGLARTLGRLQRPSPERD